MCRLYNWKLITIYRWSLTNDVAQLTVFWLYSSAKAICTQQKRYFRFWTLSLSWASNMQYNTLLHYWEGASNHSSPWPTRSWGQTTKTLRPILYPDNHTLFHFCILFHGLPQWNLPAMQETWVPPPGQTDPLEEETATHSRILAWKTPWTEEPGGLQSKGLQKNWTRLSTQRHTHVVFHKLHKTFSASL